MRHEHAKTKDFFYLALILDLKCPQVHQCDRINTVDTNTLHARASIKIRC